ncbi:MAG: pilin [bacterium]|nr:pilin [bacterium]
MRLRSVLLTAVPTAFVLGIFVLPIVAHATGIPFFDPIVPKDAQTCAAGFGALAQVVNNIIAFAITIGIVFVAPLSIAYAGFLYVVNPVNPSGIAQAKKILLNTIVGIVIALAAWLIVDTVLTVLTAPTKGVEYWSGKLFDGGDTCLKVATKLNQAANTTTSDKTTTGGTTTTTSSTDTSKITGGSCASSSFDSFGGSASASTLSCICGIESGGNAAALSKTDKTTDGYAVSVGLMQVNLTAGSVSCEGKTYDCKSAFSGAYTGSASKITVTNKSLYDDCVTAMQNATCNLKQAYTTYTSQGTKAWKNAAKEC